MPFLDWLMLAMGGLLVAYVGVLLCGRAYSRTYRERLKIEKEEHEK